MLSVLISIYSNENPKYLDECLNSLYHQSLLPNEVVLVEDGPITTRLQNILDYYRTRLNIISVSLPMNIGLAGALNKGLEFCTHDFIARMDADDICHPDRFLRQVDFLRVNSTVDIVGCWIEEFDENMNSKIIVYPTSHNEMFRFFVKRDPLAHPGVMFRKSFFYKAGDYNVLYKKDQDTELWFRGFLNGAIFANVPLVLLFFRKSSDTFTKRKNFHRILSYFSLRLLITRKLRYGFKGYFFSIVYCVIQLLPLKLTKLLYKFLR